MGVSVASIKTYPSIFFKDGRNESWIGIVCASLVITLYAIFLVKVIVKEDNFSFNQFCQDAFGKILGTIVKLFYSVVLFLTLVESCSVPASLFHTNFFIESPIWYILLFFTIPGAYIVKSGSNSVIMSCIIGIIGSIFNGINLYMLTYKYKIYRRLFPVFLKGFNFQFILSFIKILGLYSFFIIPLMLIGRIKNKANLKSSIMLGVLFTCQMLIVSTIGTLATFNIERSITISYPKMIQTQLIRSIRFELLASGEFYVIFQAVTAWTLKYIVTFTVLLMLLSSFNLLNKISKNAQIFIITFLSYIFALISTGNLLTFFNILSIFAYICFFSYFILPIIMMVISSIKSRMSKNQSNN
jgi:spore germination protein (amino acid permease)